MLDFETVQLKAETTPVSMYSSCLHIVTITNTKKDYSIIIIYIYIYIGSLQVDFRVEQCSIR